MGTTLAAIQSGAFKRAHAVVIEGYHRILTDGDPSEANNAWTGAGFSDADMRGGCSVELPRSERLRPWDDSLEHTVLRLVIQPSSDELVLEEMWAVQDGNETVLTDDLEADGATVEALDTSAFASSGEIMRGPETIGYTGTTATSFTTLTRGKYAPFGTASGAAKKFARQHKLATDSWSVQVRPEISDEHRAWIGRWVGVYLHEVTASGWNDYTEARGLWAGQIADVQQVGASLVVTCTGWKKALNRPVFQDQFRGRVREGVFLQAGMRFSAADARVSSFDTGEADDLVVVPSGASGDAEVDEGYQTLEELEAVLGDWLGDQSASGASANLLGEWRVQTRHVTDAGVRCQVVAHLDTAGAEIYGIRLTLPQHVAHFLGYDQAETVQHGSRLEGQESGTDPAVFLTSEQAPYRVLPFQRDDPATLGLELDLDESTGTWHDLTDWLPEPWRSGLVDEGENWGILRVGGQLAFAQYKSDTSFAGVVWPPSLLATYGGELTNSVREGIRVDEDGSVEVTQVVILEGPIKDLLARLLLSTGASGYNHGTYDDFPGQVGLAIPYEILGDGFLDSLDHLATTAQQDSMVIVLDRPTPFLDILMPELLLRMASLVWTGGTGEGGAKIVMPQIGPAAAASHTLTESNKATPVGHDDRQLATVARTDEHLRNVVKIDYNRTLTGEYRDVIEIRHPRSIATHGAREPVTIKARNSYGHYAATVSAVENLAGDLATRVLPFYGKPLFLVTRSIELSLFEDIVPGDLATLSDGQVRDPVDGSRGVSGQPCLVFGVETDYGGPDPGADEPRPMLGQVELVLDDRQRVGYYSPCADVDEDESSGNFDAGYDATTDTLRCKSNVYSETSETNDAQMFADGEEIYIVERDPDDPSSVTAWERTIDTVSGDDISLTAALGSPAWDNSKTYRITSREYSAADATQQPDTYLAAADDLQIEDLADAYEWAELAPGSFTAISAPPTDKPERHWGNAFGDGRPLTPAQVRNLQRWANNGISYKTAPNQPIAFPSDFAGSEAGDETLALLMPLYVGRGSPPAGTTRTLRVKAIWRSSDGSSATLRVGIMAHLPTGSDEGDPNFPVPNVSSQLSTTSTSFAESSEIELNVGPLVFAGWGAFYVLLNAAAELRAVSQLYLGPIK